MSSSTPILLMHQGALGDLIMSLRAFQALRVHHDRAPWTMIGHTESLSLIQNHLDVQEIGPLYEKRWAVLYQKEKAVPKAMRDYLRSFKRIYLFTPLLANPLRENLSRFIPESLAWIPSFPDTQKKIPLQALQKEALKALGIPWPKFFPFLDPPVKDLEEAFRKLDHEGLADEGKMSLLCIHPGSGARQKNWPLEGFLEVAEEVSKRRWATPFFTLGPVEMDRNPDWAEKIRDRGFPFLKEIGLSTLAGVLRHCRYYLGNDSGVSHLAAALGITTLVLFGPTDPALWAPQGKKVAVIPGMVKEQAAADKTQVKTDTGWLGGLSPKDVLKQVGLIIGNCQPVK